MAILTMGLVYKLVSLVIHGAQLVIIPPLRIVSHAMLTITIKSQLIVWNSVLTIIMKIALI